MASPGLFRRLLYKEDEKKMIDQRPDLRSMAPDELEKIMEELGQPKFRAAQLFRWLSQGARTEEMTDLPLQLRQQLSGRFRLSPPRLERRLDSVDGTVKLLWRLFDGESVETVLMKYDYGNTVCISTQVGCAMGCAFCASTKGGFVRDLEAGEMLDQVIFTSKETGAEINHIVLMGIGEPLSNFDNVLRFLRLVNDPGGRGLGMRRISLSTCGIVERIDKLADYNIQLTLSVSLHSVDEDVRKALMPVARRYDLESLRRACARYFDITGRRITYEYAMIDGINDSDEAARELARWIKSAEGGHVNLITLNDVPESGLRPSPQKRVRAFVKALEREGVKATVRRRLGADIDAACGQLRIKTAQKGS